MTALPLDIYMDEGWSRYPYWDNDRTHYKMVPTAGGLWVDAVGTGERLEFELPDGKKAVYHHAVRPSPDAA